MPSQPIDGLETGALRGTGSHLAARPAGGDVCLGDAAESRAEAPIPLMRMLPLPLLLLPSRHCFLAAKRDAVERGVRTDRTDRGA